MTWLHLAETEIHLYMSYYPTDLFLSIFSAIYYLSIFSNVRMLIYVIAWQFYHKIQVLLEEKSAQWMNTFSNTIQVLLQLKFWVWSVKTMTVKCAGGGCQITENKIESHHGEHTIYLSHSKSGILFLPTMEESLRALVHKHAIRGNQPSTSVRQILALTFN